MTQNLGKAMNERLQFTGFEPYFGFTSYTDFYSWDKQCFHEFIGNIIKSRDLDKIFPVFGDEASNLLEHVQKLCHKAFDDGDREVAFEVHKALFFLYNMPVEEPFPGSGENQNSPLLCLIRKSIEDSWMDSELSKIDRSRAIPDDEDEFLEFIIDTWRSYPGYCHKIFSYFENEANAECFHQYIVNDFSMNVRFYDLISLSLVGIPEETRIEVAANFWDEMGNGNSQNTHVNLFRKILLNTIGEIDPVKLCNTLSLEGLVGYNLLMCHVLSRRQYFRSLGSLAITELADPDQYIKFVKGCKRVGICQNEDNELAYYTDHIDIDSLHGEGWLRNVILPIIRRFPEAKQEIYEGCSLRLATSKNYWDNLLDQMISERNL